MNLSSTIQLKAFGTSEGVRKEWDTRGRGRATAKTWYHGTSNNFKGFDPNFDYESSPAPHTRDYELPEGVVFLTDDVNEAEGYGPKVIPVSVDAKKILKVKVDGFPSPAFDDDFNNTSGYMWSKFVNGGYDALQIIGRDRNGNPKSTLITYPERVRIKTEEKK